MVLLAPNIIILMLRPELGVRSGSEKSFPFESYGNVLDPPAMCPWCDLWIFAY